jgi:hypothetical protein
VPVVEGQTRQPEALAGKFPTGSSNLPRHTIVMGTPRGFPNPPALWLRRAKPAYANATKMGTPRGFPNPPALWLRRAKPAYANATKMGTPGVAKPSRDGPRRAKLAGSPRGSATRSWWNGRHAWLRTTRPQGHGSSSLSERTQPPPSRRGGMEDQPGSNPGARKSVRVRVPPSVLS